MSSSGKADNSSVCIVQLIIFSSGGATQLVRGDAFIHLQEVIVNLH